MLRTLGTLQPATIALVTAICLACVGQHTQTPTGTPASSANRGALVPEIKPEAQPAPGPCVDSAFSPSASDSASIYPPTAIELFIPPLPIPADVRGFHLIAEFDVTQCHATLIGMSSELGPI